MKNLLSFFALLLLVIFSSCDEEEPLDRSALNGAWNLVKVTCECLPSDLVYGEHLWTFDLSSKEVFVQNSSTKPLQILETGTYESRLTSSTIEIDSVVYDYYFEGDKLILADDPEVDGPLMEFIR